MNEDHTKKPSKNETPFERFQRLIRGLAAVPKKEIEAEEVRWREARRLKKKNADG
jgi:hypothetical protein